MATIIKTGIVGFGMSARVFHAPFISTMPAFELTAVVERSRNDAQQIYPDVQVVRSLEALLAMPEIELVIITTPNETHFPYALQALQAGKNVVLEKPFANSSEQSRQLVEAAAASAKTLSVYHNRRYVSDFLTIQEIIDMNLLGDVHEYECHFDRYRPEPRVTGMWREAPLPGSGTLYDLGSHLIDQALYLFGLPKTITADIKTQRSFSPTDDYFDLRLDFGFTKAILKSSMLVREMGPRYMVHGTKGSYIKSGDDPQEEILKTGIMPVGGDWGKEPPEIAGILHTEKDGTVIREQYPSKAGNFGTYYKKLYDTIVHGAPLSEKPEHGHNVIRLIELAFESSAKKQTLDCDGLTDAGYRK